MLHKTTYILSLFTLLLIISSFQKQNKIGEELFKQNCANCHLPNKNFTGPSFQRIRQDYGLDWAIQAVRDYEVLLKKKDINALYSYYSWGKILHTKFPLLQKEAMIKIFDYVDSKPLDSTQIAYRKVAMSRKRKVVKQ